MGADVFTPAALDFLRALAANNTPAWFEGHAGEYRRSLLAPMRSLVEALAPAMLSLDPLLEVRPRTGVIARIRRDTRFSPDKSPYRTRQWICFRRPRRDWTDRPAFFVEFGAEDCRWGMGFYAASPATMAGLRTTIAADEQAFAAAVAAAEAAGLVLAGEAYRRPPSSVAGTALARQWMGMRNAYVVRHAEAEALLSPGLASRLGNAFRAAAPLYALMLR